MISVVPSVPHVSVHQCQLSVLINATCQCHINATYQCLPVHINATYQCPSELPFNASYLCQSVPYMSAAYQCHLPVPPHQCRLKMPISAAYQCPSLQPY
ncbi:unnamed protein product [Staurois parvus]|uniref:Uncharacterized protein n=1 Tax=Staurois parvus TaxID=386267 RepID=A0ABN9CWH3_9NEOB|nr:unnamed protein product [Staurois parvus]